LGAAAFRCRVFAHRTYQRWRACCGDRQSASARKAVDSGGVAFFHRRWLIADLSPNKNSGQSGKEHFGIADNQKLLHKALTVNNSKSSN
jgi:hypothetical protein